MELLQERGPLPGPETGLLSNTRKWMVRGDTCWQSKRFYWERAPGWRAVGKGTQENCSAAWLAVLGFMVMELVSGWLWPIILIQSLSWLHTHCSDKMDSGKWTDRQCLLLTFPNSSSWRWLISSVFLIRISCHKTTHANGYCGAWPGWVVSISVLPLTECLSTM